MKTGSRRGKKVSGEELRQEVRGKIREESSGRRALVIEK